MTDAMGTQKLAAVAVEQSATTDTADAVEVNDAADVSLAERRRAQRMIVDLEVDYQCEDNYLFAYICDISSTGIFVRTTAPHPPGTRLNLRFAPPAPAAVTARMRAPSSPGSGPTTISAPNRPSASVLAHTIDDEDDDDLLGDAAQTLDLLDSNDDDADELHDPWARKHASNNNEPVRRPSSVLIDLSPIEVEGEVIWTNPFRPNDKDNTHPGMGIRFSPLDDVTRQRLLELIRRIAYLPEL